MGLAMSGWQQKLSLFGLSVLSLGLSACRPTQEMTEDAGAGRARSEVSTVRAFKISSDTDLIGGPAAQGRVGDFMLRNNYVRAIIQNVRYDAGAGPLGGNLIDADLVRSSGEGQDNFGELTFFFNLALSMDPDSVTVASDGSSGTGQIRACGYDAIYDFIDLGAFVKDDPISRWLVPYDFNGTYGLEICNTYTLGENDRHIRVETSITNLTGRDIDTPVGDILDNGGDVEQFLPNVTGESVKIKGETSAYGGFGETIYAPLDFLGFFGDGVSYAYVPQLIDGAVNSMQVSTSGVTATVIGTKRLVKVFHNNDRYTTELPDGETVSFYRDFVIGKDLGAVTDEIYKVRDNQTGTLSGTVTEEGTGTPLPNVRVSVVATSTVSAPVTQFYTDSSGKFSGTLPSGSYGLLAAQGFYFMEDGRPGVTTPISFTIQAGQSITKNFTLPRTGAITLTAQDGSDSTGSTLLPAKVMLFGPTSGTPSSAVMDITDDMTGDAGLSRMVFLTNGTATLNMKPGTYDVVFSRGFEYDVKVVKGVQVTAGAVATATGILTRVVDTAGYISGDLHVHGVNSPDSPVSYKSRVASFLAEGVEVLVMTDHDFVTDLRDTIDEMGRSNYITSIVGEEVTTWSTGHFNLFPLSPQAESPTYGAVNWMNNSANCVTFSYDDPNFDNLTVPQIFQVGSECLAEGDVLVKQVNHARYDFQGYFGQIGLNLAAFGTPGEYTASPDFFRMPDGSDLFDVNAFNTMEILNEGDIPRGTTLMNDWFGLLNLGYPKAGTSVSDTHTEVRNAGGYGRTYVKSSTDSTSTAHTSSTFTQDFARNLVAGKITAGIGPFVTMSVAPTAGGTSAGLGELVQGSGGSVTAKVRIQNPDWVDYTRVDVFVNPIVYANADNATYIDPSGLNPRFTYCNSVTDTGDCRSAATYVSSFTPSTVSIPSLGGTTRREEITLSIPFTVTLDSWVTVVVWGGRSEQYTGYGDETFAYTNPIYIDYNGDGLWTAPCANYNASQGCVYLRPVNERPDGVVSAERTLSDEELEFQSAGEAYRHLFATLRPEIH